jgi:hypothetical protein
VRARKDTFMLTLHQKPAHQFIIQFKRHFSKDISRLPETIEPIPFVLLLQQHKQHRQGTHLIASSWQNLIL